MYSSQSNYVFSVKINGKDAKEYVHNNDTYIEGRNKSEFELSFNNRSLSKVKVVFSVDGLSVMDGKTASDKSQGYIVNAWDTITVPGWRINSGKVAKFVFRPQGEKNGTYVEELKSEGFDVDAGNQGVIGCMVFKEKYIPPVYQPVYRDVHHYHHWNDWYIQPKFTYLGGNGVAGYPQNSGVGAFGAAPGLSAVYSTISATVSGPVTQNSNQYLAQNSMISADEVAVASLGTGFGEDAGFATTSVEFEAEARPDWVAVIHYDTIINLRKRGVFIEDKKPEAFPGYKDGCHIPKNR